MADYTCLRRHTDRRLCDFQTPGKGPEHGARSSRRRCLAMGRDGCPQCKPNDVVVICGDRADGVRARVKKQRETGKIHDSDGNSPAVYNIHIEGQAPSNPGIFSLDTEMQLRNLNGRDVTFTIHIEGNVHSGVECHPRHLFLGTLKHGCEVKSQLELRYSTKKEFSIVSLQGPSWFDLDYDTRVNSSGTMQVSILIRIGKSEKKSGIEVINVKGMLDGHTVSVGVPCVFVYREQ